LSKFLDLESWHIDWSTQHLFSHHAKGKRYGGNCGRNHGRHSFELGVEVVFGLPGDGINGMIRGTPHRGQAALTVLSDKIKELI
jgi:hypothetical protein